MNGKDAFDPLATPHCMSNAEYQAIIKEVIYITSKKINNNLTGSLDKRAYLILRVRKSLENGHVKLIMTNFAVRNLDLDFGEQN